MKRVNLLSFILNLSNSFPFTEIYNSWFSQKKILALDDLKATGFSVGLTPIGIEDSYINIFEFIKDYFILVLVVGDGQIYVGKLSKCLSFIQKILATFMIIIFIFRMAFASELQESQRKMLI